MAKAKVKRAPLETARSGSFAAQGTKRTESAQNYAKRATGLVKADSYIVSTQTSYNLLIGARKMMSKRLHDKTKANVDKFTSQLANTLKEEEDRILKLQSAVFAPNINPDKFIEHLNAARSPEVAGVDTSINANKQFIKFEREIKSGKFNEILRNHIESTSLEGSNFQGELVDTNKTVKSVQPKTKKNIEEVVRNTVARANLLASPESRKAVYGANADSEGVVYLANQLYRSAERQLEVLAAIGLTELPKLQSLQVRANTDKLMYHMIGNVYEYNEMLSYANMTESLLQSMQSPKVSSAARKAIEEEAINVTIQAVGNVLKSNTKQSEVGTTDIILDYTGGNPNDFIRIDAKSASSSKAIQDSYTLTLNKVPFKENFKQAIQENGDQELISYYNVLLANILTYGQLYLNEDEQQAAINMYFNKTMGEEEFLKFMNRRFGGQTKSTGANFPVLISVSTKLHRFSKLVRQMSSISVGPYQQSSQMTYPVQSGFGFSNPRKMYNSKKTAFQNSNKPAALAYVQNEMRQLAKQAADILYSSKNGKNEVSLTLKIKLTGGSYGEH